MTKLENCYQTKTVIKTQTKIQTQTYAEYQYEIQS